MTKIAIINDSHFSVHNASDIHEAHIVDFFQNQLFPYVLEHGIKHVFNLGDLLDNRKFINIKSMKTFLNVFVKFFKDNPQIKLYSLVGNHDVFYKNTNDTNSVEHFLNFDNSFTFTEPTEIKIDGIDLFMIPWLCKANIEAFNNIAATTHAKYAFGHLELTGFEFSKGVQCEEGFDPKIFKKFDKVLTGHFHYKSSKGNIHYLGSQYHLNWGDIDDVRGFHTIDIKTGELTFIENPNKLYNSFYYDEDKKYSKSFLEGFRNKFLRVIVQNKTDVKKFDVFCDKLNELNLSELQIIDIPEQEIINDVEFNPETQDTLSFLKNYVDKLDDVDVNKVKLKNFMTTLYTESL